MSLTPLCSTSRLLSALLPLAAPALPALQNYRPRFQARGLVSLPESQQMAWRSSGTSNAELVENLWRNGLVTDPRAKEAFLKV